ncbi:MAG: type II toxin-antitoxin system RelB/DinJ family antitoxin [Oscillospiraceae bacterium]|nr:type II toxin-antitoxin system RelB/DinJ family antitoxin [Oscillospiraceae bacterium]
MEKSTTLNLRVNPTIKQQAEDVLKQLGVPMATAVDMFLRQITLTGGIPFAVSLPKAPTAINADNMTAAELHAALQAGYDDIEAGNVRDASSAFTAFRDSHR